MSAILRATARVLVEVGYEGANTNRIARTAGVSVGSLYQYFPSKEALVAALVEDHIQRRVALVSDQLGALAALTLEDAIHHFVEVLIGAQRVDRQLQRVIIKEVPRIAGFDRIAAMDRKMSRLLEAFLETRHEELAIGDVRLASFVVFNAVRGTTLAGLFGLPAGVRAEAFSKEVARLVCRYLVRSPGTLRYGSR